MKTSVFLTLLSTSFLNAEPEDAKWSIGREGDALSPAISAVYKPYNWGNSPPVSIPHEKSKDITGIRFTGRYANYTGADTFYPMWAKGDAIYLSRVDPEPEKVTNPASHEFFAGHDERGIAKWSGSITAAQPILEWKNHLGSESITYLPGIKRQMKNFEPSAGEYWR